MARPPSKICLRQLRSLYRCSTAQINLERCRGLFLRATPDRAIFTSSALTEKEHILGRSTVLSQDGLDIKELPVIVRRIGEKEIQLINQFTPGTFIEEITPKDEKFKDKLMGCESVKEVFRLLDVPDDEVTAYSAAFVLQRICRWHVGNSSDTGSFVNKAILNELCDTVIDDIQKVRSETVINLIRCYCISSHPDCYPEQFKVEINNEIERRMGDNLLTVDELCTLLHVLSQCVHVDQELVNNLWIHLGNQYKLINEENIAYVYAVCRFMSKDHKYIYDLLDKQYCKCWWKLNPVETSTICQSLILGSHDNYVLMSIMAKWVGIYLHDLKVHQMLDILTVFSHFKLMDLRFLNSLERYITAKADKVNTTLIVMAVNFCRNMQYLSTKIMDIAATHFEKNGDTYDPTQTYLLLRAYGQLNYVPHNASALFSKVESVLQEKFGSFPPPVMMELLTSFIYIDRVPLNFVGKVHNRFFLQSLRDFPYSNKRDRLKAITALWEFQFAMMQAGVGREPGTVEFSNTDFPTAHRDTHKSLTRFLEETFGSSYFVRDINVKGTPYCVDFKMQVDEEGKAAHVDNWKEDQKKLAFLIEWTNFRCTNTRHLLGALVLKRRNLRALKYTLIPVDFNPDNNREWLIHMLSKHVTIPDGDRGKLIP